MSADLLAAFGAPEDSKGDSSKRQTQRTNQAQTFPFAAAENNTWQPWPVQDAKKPANPQGQDDSLWKKDTTGADVLFDAEADQGQSDGLEDDFGDFEDVEPASTATGPSVSAASTAPAGTTVDLLGLDEQTTGQLSGLSIGQTPIKGPQAFEGISGVQSHTKHDQVLLMTEEAVNDDGWDDFDDFENPQAPSALPLKQTTQLPSVAPLDDKFVEPSTTKSKETQKAEDLVEDFEDWDEFDDSQAPMNVAVKTGGVDRAVTKSEGIPSMKEERPTNVPPPAILLQALSKVYSHLAKQAGQSLDNAFLGQLALDAFKVTARIIAGRAHRWKRDTLLAQSMRIGAAGRSGGMKLTSLDKGENRREEQEIAETLLQWSQNSFVLNSTMVKAKVPKPATTLSVNLAAKTVTGSDVVSANHVCAVCGLKRNERITGVDMSVMDAFDEFWIEHWGHRDCHSIWTVCQKNDLLEHR